MPLADRLDETMDRKLPQIEALAPEPKPPTTPPGAPTSGGVGAAATPAALEVLIRFIPTGVTGAYVTATAPIGEDQARAHFFLLLLFVTLTAVTCWVGFVVRAKKRVPVPLGAIFWKLRAWPKWQMFAGALAFTSWAVAIHPAALQAIVPGAAQQVVRTAAGVGVVITGYMLTTFDQLVA